MRSDYIWREELMHILAALTPPNRLACEVSEATGLRIGDVLDMRTDKLAPRMTVRELKTGKTRRVYIPAELELRMRALAGKVYVFEGRLSPKKHRSRSAVYKDLKRAACLFRVRSLQISPHTCRKVYAVEQYHKSGGNMRKVQQLLNHSSEAITVLYAMADELTARKMGGVPDAAKMPRKQSK